ncbi:MAG: hypothetical protein F2723_06835 [Actinobacteria bacterium]|uniref:Unannotated protein n=1 Tax=freshwater metagenome TaxID=449393 RepID=A0A6J6WU32_9ZZZZ|nr:hypothetical protein [Actinomycetota bacterium]
MNLHLAPKRFAAMIAVIGLLTVAAASPSPALNPAKAKIGISLEAQPPWANAGDDAAFVLGLKGDLSGLEARAVIHTYITTRGGFERAVTGKRLGSVVGTAAAPADALTNSTLIVPLQNPGVPRDTLRVRVPLPRGGSAGVFPIELEVRDPETGEVYDSLVTFLTIVSPLTGGPAVAERLSVGWIWPIASRSPIDPDGKPSSRLANLVAPGGRLENIAAALPNAEGIAITLQPEPATLEAWSEATKSSSQQSSFPSLREALGLHESLAGSYSAINMPPLVANGLGELANQEWSVGGETIERIAETSADPSTIFTGALDANSIALLQAKGLNRAVVRSASLANPGEINLTPAQPFTLLAGTASLPAIQTDDTLGAIFEAPGSPAIRAARLLAGLSVVALELPSQKRGVVIAGSKHWSPTTASLDTVSIGLRDNPLLKSVSIADLFSTIPAERSGNRPLVHRLAPVDTTSLPLPAASLLETQQRITAFTSFAGSGEPATSALRHLLLSPNPTEPRSANAAQLNASNQAMDSFIAKIRTPISRTLTLTSRRAEVPMSFQNDTGRPLTVRLLLESDRLTFPSGSNRIIELAPNNTTLQIAVISRSSGTFPLTLTVESVDGGIVIERTRITVRSSVVSGIGALLTAAAGVFLLLWWVTHWRRSRKKSVAETI